MRHLQVRMHFRYIGHIRTLGTKSSCRTWQAAARDVQSQLGRCWLEGLGWAVGCDSKHGIAVADLFLGPNSLLKPLARSQHNCPVEPADSFGRISWKCGAYV